MTVATVLFRCKNVICLHRSGVLARTKKIHVDSRTQKDARTQICALLKRVFRSGPGVYDRG